MKSMTGYGKGVSTGEGKEIAVEIKSVNNRFLEINSRIPKGLLSLDIPLRRLIGEQVKRGSVDVFLNIAFINGANQQLCADYDLIHQYVELAEKIEKRAGVQNDLKFSTLLRINDAIKTESAAEYGEEIAAACLKAAESALDALNAMREKEGGTIKADILKLCKEFEKPLKVIKSRAGQSAQICRSKLSERLNEHLKGIEIDETRLIAETAFLADKADINEEMQRLESHLTQFKNALKDKEPQGRKLDFIGQEIGREINTIGSKSCDIEITNEVVALKNILEKIKEQIRNIE